MTDYNRFKVNELKSLLEERQIDFPTKARKHELIQLLTDSDSVSTLEDVEKCVNL